MIIVNDQKTAFCKQCGKEKPLGDFYIYETAGRLYASSLCRRCKRERVRMLYYLQRNIQYVNFNRIVDDEEQDDDDEQLDLFMVKDKTIHAKLIWFDVQSGWHNEFIPIVEFDSDAMCYKCIHILRGLSTGDLKLLNAGYRKRKQAAELVE